MATQATELSAPMSSNGVDNVLELKNVTKVFGGGLLRRKVTVAVDGVSLGIPRENPGIIAVAGESGSGKTTLARLMLGIIPPTEGAIYFNNLDISELSRRDRREFRREVQPIMQDPFEVYNPFYKVDHVLMSPVQNFGLARSKQDAHDLVIESLETVGLRYQETLGRFPHQLSGGQRQRIMVARALLLKPRIIVADEPVSMVDASLRATILGSIDLLNKELGIAVIYITHDLTTAFQISDNIIVMYQGSVVETGRVEDVIQTPQHPYTQLLVESIPRPDPSERWGRDMASQETGGGDTGDIGCRFAPRCPYVMSECTDEMPPLYRLGDTQAALCYLHRDSSLGNVQSISDVFKSGG
jgi:peptide/nickel transport system ATP-binding protein